MRHFSFFRFSTPLPSLLRPLSRSVMGSLSLGGLSLGGLSLAGLLLLSACSGSSTASKDPHGLWTGTLVTDEGICPTDAPSLLKIRGYSLVFNPATNSQTLRGTFKQKEIENGIHFHAELTEKSMDGTPYRMVFDGYPVGENIGGTFSSPRCRAHITLVRQ